MPIVSSKELLIEATKSGYAIPALNFENMEMATAIVEAATELQSPVILQTTPSTIKYMGLDVAYGIVNGLSKKYNIPIVLHLDHGDSLELVESAIKAGYSSVMIDGSKLVFEKNMQITMQARILAKDVQLEAELGKVGGKEDDMAGSDIPSYTNPEEAIKLVNKTGIDSLAIGVGTAHGLYKGIPHINTELIKTISHMFDTPLVLHGASGLSNEVIMECIRNGISKVNFATELRIAFSDAVSDYFKQNSNIIDPKKYLLSARNRVKLLVCEKIILCNSCNRI
jgi:tagatose 1,6-diphosphate aldolase GatY/KbaY